MAAPQVGINNYDLQAMHLAVEPARYEHIFMANPTARIMVATAHRISGPRDVAYWQTWRFHKNRIQHYDYFDERGPIEVSRVLKTVPQKWFNFASYVGVAGTELNAHHGSTTNQYANKDFPYGGPTNKAPQFSRSMIKDRITELFEGADSAYENVQWDVNDHDEPGGMYSDEDNRRPDGLTVLMNPEAPYANVTPEGLGEWEPGHVWYNGKAPGNALSTAQKKLINVPRVWGNNGTNRPLTKAVVQQPLLYMGRYSRGGEYFSPVHPGMFDSIASEFDYHFVPPRLLGTTGLNLGINFIKYHNCYFYMDDRAPEDKLFMFWMGDVSQPENPRVVAPGFRLVQWSPNDGSMADPAREANRAYGFMRVPQEVKGRVGWNAQVPYHTLKWRDDPFKVDAILGTLLHTYLMTAPCPWMNIVLEDMTF